MLPTGKRPAKTNWWDFSLAVYGPPKTGKTYGANTWPDALFLATEPGHSGIECAVAECYSWQELEARANEVIAMSEAGKLPFRTIVFDTVDAAYSLAVTQVLAETGATGISDGKNSFGKGNARARAKIMGVIRGLMALKQPLILIGQEYPVESEDADGVKRTRFMPFPKQLKEIGALVDVLCRLEAGKEISKTGSARMIRKLRIGPSPDFFAGDRSGHLIDGMPFTFEAYKACFDNKEVK